MRYCSYCGEELDEQASVCSRCNRSTNFNQNKTTTVSSIGVNDIPVMVYLIIGFFFPFIGLVLYFILLDKYVERAKATIKGVLLRVVATVLFSVLGFIFWIFWGFNIFRIFMPFFPVIG